MKRFSSLFLFFIPLILFSQEDTSSKGIKWVTGLSWEQVLAKAKSENKLIFVDCYATWCVPCKKMDKEVFTKREVGDYFNKNFICAKLQMDQTAKDDEVTKSNYKTVQKFFEIYRITNFPTYLFITADGRLIHKSTGYTEQGPFIKMAKLISQPGYVYIDSYKKYDSLVALYRRGKPVYLEMPYLIETAKRLQDKSVLDSFSKDYYSYLKGLSPRQLLTKQRIEFLSKNITRITDPFMKIFVIHKAEINSIMKNPLYCRFAIDSIIGRSVTDSVLQQYYKTVSFDSAKNKGAEPSWDVICKIVNLTFGESYAERAVRVAKVSFYRSILEYKKAIQVVDVQIRERDLNLSDLPAKAWVNSDAWNVFLFESDKEAIGLALSTMKRLVYDIPDPLPSWMDTYANLLYKGSRLGYIDMFDKAISIEADASVAAQKLYEKTKNSFWKEQSEVYLDTQIKMKQGLTTWSD